jgi:DNA-directed RNA polymerase specialized sigma24 family protein
MMSGVDDQARVEAVYRSVHPRLWRSLLTYTGDAELASDAEAEAFAQALGRGGEAVDDVAAWVWRSAFRIAAGLLAARLRSNDLRPAEGSTPPTGSVAEFLGLLADLSPQQRACVALRYVGEYTAPEIGELLGTSAGTVRVQLHRAHAALRDTIVEAEHA